MTVHCETTHHSTPGSTNFQLVVNKQQLYETYENCTIKSDNLTRLSAATGYLWLNGSISSSFMFMRYSMSKNALTLKSWSQVTQGH